MNINKKIWIYGKHAVIAALLNKNRKIYKALISPEAYKQIESLLKNRKTPTSFTTNKELDYLFKNAAHQGVALEASPIFQHTLTNISDVFKKKHSLIVMLDQLTDPQNVGNIIRSAHAFNADAILTSKNHSFSETSALTKAACGAIDNVPVIFITNLISTIKKLKNDGYWIAGLDSKATEHIHKFKFASKTVVVLGAEGSGLRDLTRKNCDFLLKIAMHETADSINASNACAIAMHNYFTREL